MKNQRATEVSSTPGKGEILKEEVDIEYSRLIRNAAGAMSEGPTAKVVCAILKEARKALSKELIAEAKIINPHGGFTRRYLILEVVRARLDADIIQVNGNIVSDGVRRLVGAVPSHDDARTSVGRTYYKHLPED